MDKDYTNLEVNMTNSETSIMNTSSQIPPSLTITDNSDNTLLHSLSLFSTSNCEPKSISSDFLQSGPRKSAFQPYKQVSCTPLTNLQRGNTQAEGASIIPTDINIHTLAGRGELTEDDLKNEKNIDVVDKDGYTPLHWAAAFGQYNAIQLILDHGANINKIGINEETALHLAANGGHHEVIRLLISHGAEVNRADHLLNTALMYAAKGNHPHSCNELLIGGADLGLSNMNDETAFTISIKNNCNLGYVYILNFSAPVIKVSIKKGKTGVRKGSSFAKMFEAQEINAEHKDLIHDVAYDFYGQRMATCSSDQYVKVWDQNAEGKWILTSSWKAHSGSVWKVTWAHPEFGQVLATCSFDRTAAVWEEVVGETPGPSERGIRHWVRRTNLVDSRTSVTDVKFGPKSQGLQLATCSAEGIVRIYEAPDVMNLTQWTLQHEVPCKLPCSCISWNPSLSKNHPQMLAVGSDDANPINGGKVFIYEYSENSRRWIKLETLNSVLDPVHDIAFAPNLGRSFHILSVATKDVRIFNITPDNSDPSGVTKLDVQTVAQFDDHGCTVWRVCWNVIGTVLASSGDDGTVRMFKMNYVNSWKSVAIMKGDGSLVPNDGSKNLSNALTSISQTARYIKLGSIITPKEREASWH